MNCIDNNCYMETNINGIHTCPHCGKSYYRELYSMCTALAWTPVYKDGVLMNSNPNRTTTCCECLNCGKQFSFEE